MPAGLAAAAALSAALGTGQAIAGAKKTAFDKRNKEKLDELLGLEERGGLGLTGAERRIQERGLMNPVRQAASATRRQAEALQAGSASGADLARLRSEQTGAIAGAGERAALALDAADARKEAAQRQELAQRSAIQEERRAAREASVLSGLGQAAGVAGQLAGGVPEVLRAAGLHGAPIKDTAAFSDRLDAIGLTGEARNIVNRMDPNKLAAAVASAEEYNQTGDKSVLTPEAIELLKLQSDQDLQEVEAAAAQNISFQEARDLAALGIPLDDFL